MSTERLYYRDSYLADFTAHVVETSGDRRRIYLDQTAFYPTSGGQPFDTGDIGGVRVIDVIDEGDRIAHLTQSPVTADDVACRIDWARRFDHMQQHTGQHLLSAVLVELFGFPTVSFHLSAEYSTIDIQAPSLDARQAAEAERRANQIVFENRPVAVSFEHAQEAAGLRKASEREGVLRIVSIDRLDRSACGGTHVRSTGEIGPILVRKLEKMRGNVRIEFLCGMRAVRRARTDYEALSAAARSFSAQLDEVPGLIAAQTEKLQETEKARRKLALELAQAQGRELYAATEPDASGIRRVVRRTPSGSIDDELRALAQSFAAGSKAVFLAGIENPPAFLLAVSKDSGLHAGDLVKASVTAAGGRGGGNATVAQGSVPSREAFDGVWQKLSAL